MPQVRRPVATAQETKVDPWVDDVVYRLQRDRRRARQARQRWQPPSHASLVREMRAAFPFLPLARIFLWVMWILFTVKG